MALWKFWPFKLVSKISQKLFELGAWTWSAYRGWCVDYLLNVCAKSKHFCGITTLQIQPYLGTSKCWGHSVLQTPDLVHLVSISKILSHYLASAAAQASLSLTPKTGFLVTRLILHVWTAMVLMRLHGCAGSPKPMLFTYKFLILRYNLPYFSVET